MSLLLPKTCYKLPTLGAKDCVCVCVKRLFMYIQEI